MVPYNSGASDNRVAAGTDKVGLLCLCSVSVALAWSLRWKPMKDGIQGFRGVNPADAEAQLRHTMLNLSPGPFFLSPLPTSFSSLSLMTLLVMKDAFWMFFWACFPDPCLWHQCWVYRIFFYWSINMSLSLIGLCLKSSNIILFILDSTACS